jgi:hypothetical protein
LEVTVTVGRIQDRLTVVVTNSAPRLREKLMPASFGDGLRNVGARLFAAYDGDGTISIGPDPICGTRAGLNLPMTVKNTNDAAEWANWRQRTYCRLSGVVGTHCR